MIDVLIPTYNRENTIVACVGSALAQNDVITIVHVVDNASQDNTVSLLKKNFNSMLGMRLIIHEYKETVSMVENWNRCLDLVSSDYFKFLFSDDILDLDFCKETLKVLQDNDRVDLVVTDLSYFKVLPNQPLKIRRYQKEGLHKNSSLIYRSLLTRNCISAPSNCLIRSNAAEGIRFDSNRVAADWIFFVNLLSKRPRNAGYFSLNNALCHFRVEGKTETNTLKMSAQWVEDNYNARMSMANNYNWFLRLPISFFTLIYCIVVTEIIASVDSVEFNNGLLFLRDRHPIVTRFVRPVIKIILSQKRIKNWLKNR